MTDTPGNSPPRRRRRRRRSQIPKRFAHLSMWELRLAELLSSGALSTSEAMRQAGISPTSYSVRERANKGDIRQLVRWLLDTEGGSPLEAVRVLTGKLGAKETKFFQKDGLVTDQRDVDAHAIQLDASKTILELHGAFPDKHEVSPAPAPPKLRVTQQEVTLPDGTKGMQRVVEFGGPE